MKSARSVRAWAAARAIAVRTIKPGWMNKIGRRRKSFFFPSRRTRSSSGLKKWQKVGRVDKNNISLESVYSAWQKGEVDTSELGIAASLECECGNAQGTTCFASKHHDMRIDMISAYRYLEEHRRGE